MKRQRFRPIVGLITAMAVVVTALIVGAVPASAAGSRAAGQEKGSNVWYGGYKGSSSEIWYCGDPTMGGAYRPEPGETASVSQWGSKKTTTNWDSKNGPAIGGAKTRQLAYLLSKYGRTTSDSKAAQLDWAVRYLIGGNSAVPGGGSLENAGRDLIAEAEKYAGPYDVSPKIYVASNGATASLRDYRPESANGYKMSDYSGTLKISGPATFPNGNKTMSAPAGTPVTLTVTGDAQVTVTATWNDLPATVVSYREAPGSAQDAMIGGTSSDVDGNVKFTAQDDTPPPAPSPASADVTTESSSNEVAPGDEITDSVVLSISNPGVPYSGTATGGLYRTGTNDQVGDPVSFAFNGAGTYTSPAVKIPADAKPQDKFSWRWTFPAYADDDWTVPGFQTPDAIPSETAAVGAFTPEVKTQISSQDSTVGDAIRDRIDVAGIVDGRKIDIAWELYGPYATLPALTEKCEGTPVASGTVSTDKNGSITTPDYVIPAGKAGYYTYVETTTGTDDYKPVATKCGEVTETTLTKAQPRYKTKVSHQKIELGHSIRDAIMVDGLADNAKLNITWEIYGPFTNRPGAESCTPAHLAKKGTVTATRNGTINTPAFTPKTKGYYTYVEHNGEEGFHRAFATKCGETTETSLVESPPAPPTTTLTKIPSGGAGTLDIAPTGGGDIDGGRVPMAPLAALGAMVVVCVAAAVRLRGPARAGKH